MKKILLLFLCVFYFLPSRADNTNIDSLNKALLHAAPSDSIFILKELGWEYSTTDQAKAFSYTKMAMDLADRIHSPNGKAAAINVNGIIYWYGGDLQNALNDFLEALSIYEGKQADGKLIGTQGGIASCLNNIGMVQRDLKNFKKALEYYTKGLEIRKTIGNKTDIAASYSNIAGVIGFLEGPERSLLYNLQALKLRREIGDPYEIANSLDNTGVAYQSLGDYIHALNLHREAMTLRKQVGDPFGLAMSFGNIGSCYLALKDYDNALRYFEDCLETVKTNKNKESEKNTYNYISEVYMKKNDYRKAYEYYVKYSTLKDSLFNNDKMQQMSDAENKYQGEKKDKEIQLLNKDKVLDATQLQKQKALLTGFIIGFILVLALVFFVYNSYRQKRKANLIITLQKEEVEKQKEIIEDKQKEILDSIQYAKRIQDSLLPTERYMERALDRLKRTDRS